MSSDEIVIRVENLSKCYTIYNKPDDRLKQFVLPRINRLLGRTPKQYFREFWALQDISFEVRKGETVGIIGRNGSGKSTLLQIICGTLSPSGGNVEVHGRVAALLELGSGFSPDFTGRENIYMNGAVLGLSKVEIDQRFDAIAAFADIGEFIEQPVKTYSSGMVVRLAFAVIAHVDADILVIDEALAVGDTVFTQKCMRFLRRFMESGTLLFVSHDSAAVMNLCRSALWLSKGELKLRGAAKVVADAYLESTLQTVYGEEIQLETLQPVAENQALPAPSNTMNKDPEVRIQLFDSLESSSGWKTGAAEIESVGFIDEFGKPLNSLCGGESVCLTVQARIMKEMYSPIIGFYVKDRLGQALFGEHTFAHTNPPLSFIPGQTCEAKFQFYVPLLPNGDYAVTVSIAEGTPLEHVQHHWIHDAILFKVASNKLRHGLVGIPFQSVSLKSI